MNDIERLAVRATALVVCVLAACPAIGAGPTGTTVQCVFADGRPHTFGPGRDRCWDPINGRTLAPKAVLPCAVPREGDPTPRINYVFSEQPSTGCEPGHPATADEIRPTLGQLGARERALVDASPAR